MGPRASNLSNRLLSLLLLVVFFLLVPTRVPSDTLVPPYAYGHRAQIALFLPETYHPILLKKRAKRMRKEDPEKHGDKYAELERADFSLKSIAQRTLLRPIIMLFVEPIVLAVTIYLSVVYSVLYATFSIFPIIWGQLRGLSNGEVGLIFIGVGIGTTLGARASLFRLSLSLRVHPPSACRQSLASTPRSTTACWCPSGMDTRRRRNGAPLLTHRRTLLGQLTS